MLRFAMVAVFGDDETSVKEVVAMLRLLCGWVDGGFGLVRRSEELEKVRIDW